MLSNNYKWLSHLEDSIPLEATKNNISMYTIALEAWRRGISVYFYRKIEDGQVRLRYKLRFGNKEYLFSGSKGSLITPEAVKICDDKSLTYDTLAQKNVPVPKGKKFNENHSDQELIDYAKEINFPVVLKPTDGRAGKGVYANIQTEEELINALKNVRVKMGYKEVILQQHVYGNEIRVFVFKDKVISAINRIPANVVGDGKKSIRQLIKDKNELRKSVPHLYFRPIRINSETHTSLKKINYNLDTILPKGQRVFLRDISNISAGGDPIDYTEKLTEKQKDIAIRATQAVPGLLHCGLDMIINEDTNEGVIIELNTRPGLGSHLFPVEGVGVDVPKLIIDHYFPETKDSIINNESFFDFDSAVAALRFGAISEVEVRPMPMNKLYKKRVTLELKRKVKNKIGEIKQLAIAYNINGHLELQSNKKVELVIATEDQLELTKFIKEIEELLSDDLKTITKCSYTKPVRIGFLIKGDLSCISAALIKLKTNQIFYEMSLIANELIKFKIMNHLSKFIRKALGI